MPASAKLKSAFGGRKTYEQRMKGARIRRRENRIRPGPVSAAEADERKKFIIRTATEEFLSKGFEGVTLAEIAGRCRISKTTLYGLFESKEALFSHVAIASIENFRYDIEKALDLKRPFRHVIHDVVELMVETSRVGEGNNLLRLVVAEGKRIPALGRLVMQRTYELLSPLGIYLQAVSGKRRLTSDEALQAAYHLMSMSVGGFGYLLVKPDALFGDSAAWVKSVVQLFIDRFPEGAHNQA